MDLDEVQRAFFDSLYTNRILLVLAGGATIAVAAAVAWRRGWFAAARRHPGRSGALTVAALIVGVPLLWYVASPLWIRTELVEPGPAVILDAAVPSLAPDAAAANPTARATSLASATAREPTPFVARRLSSGAFSGTDDFHYGRGTASIIETAPGEYALRLADFSVRNGPDLFVYLSPARDDYAKGALELGRLKATDGSFGYVLPPGTDPTDFSSAIIWCKQFSHLFAVALLSAD